MTRKFYIAKGFEDAGVNLPKRATRYAAGYDFEAVEDTLVPSMWLQVAGNTQYFPEEFSYNLQVEDGEVIPMTSADQALKIYAYLGRIEKPGVKLLVDCEEEVFRIDPEVSLKPTLVKTGVKADMEVDEGLKLYNRSSNPKLGLVLANSVGVVDKDYFNNPGNDGHIMFAFFNFSAEDYWIKKGDRIGQGIFEKFLLTEDDEAIGDRVGGFGSTNV